MSETKLSPKQDKIFRVFFICFLILFIADKAYMLINYGFKYTDDDQTIIWLAAKDMLLGHFYQPCFYGQTYNPLIESFLALPFLACKIPVHIALPLVSTILGSLPFLLFAFLLRKKYPVAALISLALPIGLPWFFSYLTLVPRGMVTGIAIGSIASALLLFGKPRGIIFFISGMLIVLALTANPNCILFLAPVCMFVWIKNIRNIQFYLFTIAGMLLMTAFPIYISYFYKLHPSYVVHVMHGIVPQIGLMLEAITHSDWYLQEISLIRHHALAYILIIQMAAAGYLFVKNKKAQSVAIIFGMIIMLISFGIPKVHDGGDRVNFPLCRMYLGLPFSFVIIAFWVEQEIDIPGYFYRIKKYVPAAFLMVTGFCVLMKYQTISQKFPDEVKYSSTVIVKSVANVCKTCDTLQSISTRYHTDLVVFEGPTRTFCYGCAALSYPFETLYPAQERRRWRMDAEEKTNRNAFLLMPEKKLFLKVAEQNQIPVRQVNQNPDLYLVETQGRPAIEIIRKLHLDIDLLRSNPDVAR